MLRLQHAYGLVHRRNEPILGLCASAQNEANVKISRLYGRASLCEMGRLQRRAPPRKTKPWQNEPIVRSRAAAQNEANVKMNRLWGRPLESRLASPKAASSH
jgi:hypothetical protein